MGALHPKQKVIKRAVGPHRRTPSVPHMTPYALSRNDLLDDIAAAYEKSSTKFLPAMNQLRILRPHQIGEQLAGAVLQPAIDMLSARGFIFRDATIRSFLIVSKLYPREIRRILSSERGHIHKQTLANRFRRFKRNV